MGTERALLLLLLLSLLLPLLLPLLLQSMTCILVQRGEWSIRSGGPCGIGRGSAQYVGAGGRSHASSLLSLRCRILAAFWQGTSFKWSDTEIFGTLGAL